MTQPEPLRLADALEMSSIYGIRRQAAAALRQLHEANEAFGKRQEWWNERMFVLEQQHDALLEALKMLVLATKDVSVGRYDEEVHDIALSKARAAIKAVEEGK